MRDLILSNQPTTEVSPLKEGVYQNFVEYLNVKPASIRTYKTGVKRFLSYLITSGIEYPTPKTICDFMDDEVGHLKATTRHSYLVSIKIFFSWLEQEGLYFDIAKRIKAPQPDSSFKHDYMSAAQCKRILSGIDKTDEAGKRDYALFALLVTTGIRTIEAARANTDDLATRGSTPVLYIQGKGRDDKGDYVKIPEPTECALRDYLATRESAENKAGFPLFTSTSNNNRGQRITTRSISGIIKRHMIEAGYNSDRLTAHSCRHTAGVINLLNGGTLEETATMLRHADTNVTRIYSHMIERDNNNSEARIAEAIFG